MTELIGWLADVLPLLVKRAFDRTDKDLEFCSVKAYWAGTVLRIDIQIKSPPG